MGLYPFKIVNNFLNFFVEKKEMPSEVKIYTTGYTGKDIADLKPLLEELDAFLIDIRFIPVSKQHQWHKNYLQILIKNRYRHVQNLGNRAYKENKIKIQNLELGLRTILSFEVNLVLMCGCTDLKQCHRFVIMKALSEKGFEVEEIENWKF